MIDEREWQKKFDNITAGRENEGFIEWKALIVEQIKNYEVNSLENLIKRKEIVLKELKEDDEFRYSFYAGHFLTIMIMLIPFIGTIILTAFNTQIVAYDFSGEQDVIREFAEIVQTAMQDLSDSLVQLGVWSAVISFVACVIAKLLDSNVMKRKCMKKIYLEEVLVVLRQELEKKRNSNNITVNT